MPESFPFDSFARDNLPPREQWPDLLLDGLHYPDQLNCVTALLDDRVAAGEGLRPCLMSLTETWSYADLLTRVNRIANVLSHQLGMVRGKLVLLRAPNTKLMVAAYLAVIKAGVLRLQPCRCCERGNSAPSSTRRESIWRCAIIACWPTLKRPRGPAPVCASWRWAARPPTTCWQRWHARPTTSLPAPPGRMMCA